MAAASPSGTCRVTRNLRIHILVSWGWGSSSSLVSPPIRCTEPSTDHSHPRKECPKNSPIALESTALHFPAASQAQELNLAAGGQLPGQLTGLPRIQRCEFRPPSGTPQPLLPLPSLIAVLLSAPSTSSEWLSKRGWVCSVLLAVHSAVCDRLLSPVVQANKPCVSAVFGKCFASKGAIIPSSAGMPALLLAWAAITLEVTDILVHWLVV